jgi:hypothetical protein
MGGENQAIRQSIVVRQIIPLYKSRKVDRTWKN